MPYIFIMEIKYDVRIKGKGLFATKTYKKGDIIFILSGETFSYPKHETIHIGDNKHIYDIFCIYINHSFYPSIYINNVNVIALHDIQFGEELAFNYNNTEINMASSFYVDNMLVNGKQYLHKINKKTNTNAKTNIKNQCIFQIDNCYFSGIDEILQQNNDCNQVLNFV